MQKNGACLVNIGNWNWATILGPVHGHPVQPELVGQGDTAQQGQLTIVKMIGLMDKDNNDNKLLNQSWVATLLIMFVDCHLTVWSWKFSASSLYPGCNNLSAPHLDNHAHGRFDIASVAGQLGGHDGNDSDIETKAKWFDEPCNNGPNPSKMLAAMAAEVCPLSPLTLLVNIDLKTFF